MKNTLIYTALLLLLLGWATHSYGQAVDGEIRITIFNEGKQVFDKTLKGATWQDVCNTITGNGIPLDPDDTQDILSWKPDVTKKSFTYNNAQDQEMMVVLRRILQDDGFVPTVAPTPDVPPSDTQIAP
jgi:hypothetical protein